jgi:hypothetical protein
MNQWEERQTKVAQPWAQKPYFKKKRSFKRQRSQVIARPKPEQTSKPEQVSNHGICFPPLLLIIFFFFVKCHLLADR